jgi:glyoxylase-like metal-dependent hydrolase (beta-lactamase superfamily II)
MLHYSVLKVSSPLGSNVYFLNTNPAVIIDTGHPHFAQETVDILKRLTPLDSVAYIFCTHSHPDHLGATVLLKNLTSAKVCAFPCARNDKFTSEHKRDIKLELSPFETDHILKNEEIIELNDDSIRVLYTPGHADDHCSYYFTQRRFLFTGDLIAHDDIGFLNLNKPYRDALKEMNTSFDICAKLPARKVFPGHGNPYRIVPWEKYIRKLLLFDRNPELLISHVLISPFLFYLWAKGPTPIDKCKQYVTEHAFLFDGFIEDISVDQILQEFNRLLPLLEILNVVHRNGDLIQGHFSREMTYQWYK